MPRRWLPAAAAGLVLVALVLRLGVVAATPEYTPRTDDADFDRVALSIARGDGYPPTVLAAGGGASAFRPPGFAYTLGAVYAIAGVPGAPTRWTVARCVEAVLGAVTVALIGLVALLLLGALPALIAMALAAIHPPLVIPSASLLSESLFLPLELGAVAAVLLFRRTPALPWVALAGALGGAATLTRSNGTLLVAALAVGVWFAARRHGSPLRATAVLLVCAAVVVAPWSIRNAVELDAFVPTTTQGGFGLAGTYNDLARADERLPGSWRVPTTVPEAAEIIRRPGLSEAEVNRELRALSLAYIRDHPGYVAKTTWWSTRRTLHLADAIDLERDLWDDYGVGDRLSDAGVYAFWVVALLAVAGAATQAVRRAPRFVWLVPLAMVASAVPIAGNMRYRIPADPFLLLLAAAALAAGARMLTERRASA